MKTHSKMSALTALVHMYYVILVYFMTGNHFLSFHLFSETPVEIIRPPTDVFEPPGSDVVYEVELNKDRVEVKWLRNNMTVVQGDKYQMMSEGKIHRLQVCEIRPRDQGEYRVIAKDKDARAKLELAGKLEKKECLQANQMQIHYTDVYNAFVFLHSCTNN